MNRGKLDISAVVATVIIVVTLILVIVFDAFLKPYFVSQTGIEGDTVILEPGLKLKDISWREGSLWYLTREMNDDDKAESYVFQQSSGLGKITIIEQNLEDAGWE